MTNVGKTCDLWVYVGWCYLFKGNKVNQNTHECEYDFKDISEANKQMIYASTWIATENWFKVWYSGFEYQRNVLDKS